MPGHAGTCRASRAGTCSARAATVKPMSTLLPDFSHVTPASQLATVLDLMEHQRGVVASLLEVTDAPTVDNFLRPFELSGAQLEVEASIFYTYCSSIGGADWDRVEAELSPKMTAHEDALYMDPRLYRRFEQLCEADLDPETAYTAREHLKRCQQSGAGLAEAARGELAAINNRMAELSTEIGQRIVQAGLDDAVEFTEAELSGLSASQREGLAGEAAAADSSAAYLATLRLPTQQPLLDNLDDAAARARLLEASLRRCDGHDAATDTRESILELVRLRARAAKLLGYPNHAAYVAANSSAGTLENIDALLSPMMAPIARNVAAEAEELAAFVKERWGKDTFTASDWVRAQNQARAEKFSIDDEALTPYLELDNVLEKGVFYAANKLYGLTFTRTEERGYTDDVVVWKVAEEDGTFLGYFLGDYYARPGKRGGAWMHAIVQKSAEGSPASVICNNLNITKPAPGEPTLLSWDEVETAFHEFGHALHGFLSDVRWPSVAGTNVPRDFVEYPSQVNEIWARHPEVLARYARHYQTGEVLPAAQTEALVASRGYGAGFRMCEIEQAVLLDQAWHRLSEAEVPASPADFEAFEEKALRATGVQHELVPPRYRSAYFNHVFSGGYSAGYYSYTWCEALDADTVAWFQHDAAREGDLGLNREAGEKLRREVLSRGNSRDPKESFAALLGRDVDATALLKRHGLVEA